MMALAAAANLYLLGPQFGSNFMKPGHYGEQLVSAGSQQHEYTAFIEDQHVSSSPNVQSVQAYDIEYVYGLHPAQ